MILCGFKVADLRADGFQIASLLGPCFLTHDNMHDSFDTREFFFIHFGKIESGAKENFSM